MKLPNPELKVIIQHCVRINKLLANNNDKRKIIVLTNSNETFGLYDRTADNPILQKIAYEKCVEFLLKFEKEITKKVTKK